MKMTKIPQNSGSTKNFLKIICSSAWVSVGEAPAEGEPSAG